MQKISYAAYLKKYSRYPLIDVRTPLEFKKGRILSARNIALFSNSQRAVIGTVYKQKGQKQAILQGLKFVRLFKLGQKIQTLSTSTAVIYCARGGMRSSSVGWLLELLGYRVLLLKNGYKGYRKWVLEQFSKAYPLAILSGKTGAGKTKILKKALLHIDLENLAGHRGSVFGAYQTPQPTQELFENRLAHSLYEAAEKRKVLEENRSFSSSGLSPKKSSEKHFFLEPQKIWIEDESRKIGRILIPDPLFCQMQKASGIILNVDIKKRARNIIFQYKKSSLKNLKQAVFSLRKRLGLEAAEQVLLYLENKDYERACFLLLKYYDKKYEYTLQKRKSQTFQIVHISSASQSIKRESSSSLDSALS